MSESSVKVNVLDAKVESENDALNIMVNLITVAQSRGAFSLQESAKLWDCIKKFQKLNHMFKKENTES